MKHTKTSGQFAKKGKNSPLPIISSFARLWKMRVSVRTFGNLVWHQNMQNFDPVVVHTGDSIVIAPTVTLADKEYQMLRSAALNIISALKIERGCNIYSAELWSISKKWHILWIRLVTLRKDFYLSKHHPSSVGEKKIERFWFDFQRQKMQADLNFDSLTRLATST